MLHVALIEPQIAPNTGNIARTCAATGTALHLIEPLGFALSETQLERSSVHYWESVDVWVHPGWRYFREAVARERCWYFSAKGRRPFWEAPVEDGACLVFGNETDGMPMRILEKHPDRVFQIPMHGPVRSLNLATAVGIVLYDALRRLGYTSDAGLPIRHRHPAGARS
jgi:tRNA (cytidine/uridine-2'-O-)-methyltransferase